MNCGLIRVRFEFAAPWEAAEVNAVGPNEIAAPRPWMNVLRFMSLKESSLVSRGAYHGRGGSGLDGPRVGGVDSWNLRTVLRAEERDLLFD